MRTEVIILVLALGTATCLLTVKPDAPRNIILHIIAEDYRPLRFVCH